MGKKKPDKAQTSYEGEIQVHIDTDAVKEFYKRTNDKIFFLRDTLVTPRMFNLWRKEGLVSQLANPTERKWVSFSLRDFIWVKIVYDLRLMGCAASDIKKAKEVCLQTIGEKADEKLWQKSIDAVLKSYTQNKAFNEAQLEEVKAYFKANTLNKVLAENAEINITVLDSALNNIIASGNDWNLYLFLPSQFALQNQSINKANKKSYSSEALLEYTTTAQKRKTRQSGMQVMLFSPDFAKGSLGLNLDDVHQVPHIKIPIKNYLWDFLLDPAMQSQLGKMELLTPDEFKLIEEVRLGNKKEIVVKFNNQKMERIEIIKDLEKNAEKRLMELIMQGEYCDINIKAQNGKISSFQKSTKKKL